MWARRPASAALWIPADAASPVVRDWSSIARVVCSSLITAGTKTASRQKAVTLHRLSWMRTTCCESLRPCRLQEPPHSCAQELRRTLPYDIGGVGKYHKLAVVGLGGLGHMAIKIAKALGTEVTALSTSERKRQDALRLGATDFALTSQADTFTRLQRHFDFILDTVSAPHNYNAYVNLLRPMGP